MSELTRDSFFSKELNIYVSTLHNLTLKLIDKYSSVPRNVSLRLLHNIWTANKYLIGSTTKTIPYELVYALSDALADWSSNANLITTALTDDFNFYLQGIDPDFQTLVKSYLGFDIPYNLIQIALPKLYIHKPLYSIPLYHELGHFIDNKNRITNASLLLHKPNNIINHDVEIAHRKEFFADLFSISYIGDSAITFLNEFASGNPDTFTHPATSRRIEVMKSFLNNIDNEIVNLFNDTIAHLGLSVLYKRFIIPNVHNSYDNIRPYSIANKKELHGILTSGWNYLQSVSSNTQSQLHKITDEFESARIINDLTEKSIRNMMLKEKWEDELTK